MRVEIGDVSTTVPEATIVVGAFVATEDESVHRDVILDRTDLPGDAVTQLTTAQARRLAELL
ncbi:MAG: hypothetical protein HOV94_23205, partial [Saccharothrix sp.]|nr:hypothetical protein [Saccharothrix sp.]